MSSKKIVKLQVRLGHRSYTPLWAWYRKVYWTFRYSGTYNVYFGTLWFQLTSIRMKVLNSVQLQNKSIPLAFSLTGNELVMNLQWTTSCVSWNAEPIVLAASHFKVTPLFVWSMLSNVYESDLAPSICVSPRYHLQWGVMGSVSDSCSITLPLEIGIHLFRRSEITSFFDAEK